MAAFNPQGGWNQLGRFAVYMTGDTLDPDSMLMATPANIPRNGPALLFNLDVAKTSTLNMDNQGNLTSQTISLGNIANVPFKRPAFLEINLDGYVDLNHIPAGQEVYVVTYDKKNKIWVKVPILALDRKQNRVTVQANHFSTWGAGLGNSLPQNGANILLFDSHYTSLFTGAARYSLPVWTPPGRAGMAPDISLSYSSSIVDGVLGNVQASWVGEGWNIDGVEIVRKIITGDAGYGYVDAYTLTINGATYDLLVDPTHPNRYYSKEGAFLYVERHNDALGNNPGSIGHDPNILKSDEWWEVVTTDGTRYFLGRHQDSEQLALMYGYSCTNASPCTTPDGAYASSGYAGNLKNMVALRWRVDRVLDVHNNTIDYTYTEEHPASALVPQFDRASYLDTISYTGHVGDLEPGYQVKFRTVSRTGDGVPAAFNLWDNYDTKQLDEIDVCYPDCSSGTVVRKYQLGYSTANVPDANGTLVLSTVQILGSLDGTVWTSSPTIRFAYANFDNRAVAGSNNKYPYPRLVEIENGFGGSLNYTYENDGRGTSDWFDWRVKSVNLQSGAGTAAIQGYNYANAAYAGAGTSGELIGYADVTESTYDFDGTTKLSTIQHRFGTVGLDTGYELSTSFTDANGAVLTKTEHVYVTDNSQAPFTGWNYRYLYQVTDYVKSGGSLIQTRQTQYVHDPGTGNLAEQDEYNGLTLQRKEYSEYWPNFNPKVYILDKPTRQVTVDATNTIFADTRLGYDGVVDFRNDPQQRAITEGDLTLVQKLSDATHTSGYPNNMEGLIRSVILFNRPMPEA